MTIIIIYLEKIFSTIALNLYKGEVGSLLPKGREMGSLSPQGRDGVTVVT